MNPTGNREAGDRNLSTADLAAAGRRPPQAVDHDEELDSPATSRTEEGRSGAPRVAKDAPLSDREAADRGDERRGSAAERSGASMADRSAAERRSATMADRSAAGKPAMDRGAEQLDPLFPAQAAGEYRTRWAAVQSSFVDDPRRAVREGDELVAQMMKDLAQSFATERGRLETQLGQTGETTTETLRVSLRRYRSFFERLLSL
jgi:hypothetical protein